MQARPLRDFIWVGRLGESRLQYRALVNRPPQAEVAPSGGGTVRRDFGAMTKAECKVPKAKTHKGIKKRVKVTARGKVKFHKHNKGHLQSGKSGNRKRRLRGTTTITGPYADKMVTLLGRNAR